MGKFRWAYIGNGSIANSTANDIKNGNHKIVSVYGRSFEKAKSFADKHGAVAFDNFEDAVKARQTEFRQWQYIHGFFVK